MHSPEPLIHGNPGLNVEKHIDVAEVITAWNLNVEQSLVVRLIAEKSLSPFSDPLVSD